MTALTKTKKFLGSKSSKNLNKLFDENKNFSSQQRVMLIITSEYHNIGQTETLNNLKHIGDLLLFHTKLVPFFKLISPWQNEN